jgi:uncharacterized protein (TIRG00374 family)
MTVAAVLTVLSTLRDWADLEISSAALTALVWVLPAAMALHAVKMALAASAWRTTVADAGPRFAALLSLRLCREGIDSLLPLAQVGGELFAARQLARQGVGETTAFALTLADMVLEFAGQLIFLAIGLAAVAILSPGLDVICVGASILLVVVCIAFVVGAARAGQSSAMTRLITTLAKALPSAMRHITPAIPLATLKLFGRRRAVARAAMLHAAHWLLGSCETWLVLLALDVPAGPLQAIVLCSLGAAGRSVGFAVPAGIGFQEGGFLLAAAAAGIPESAALTASVMRRAREIACGLIALALLSQGQWRERSIGTPGAAGGAVCVPLIGSVTASAERGAFVGSQAVGTQS